MSGISEIFEKAKYSKAQEAKIRKTMAEFERGELKTPEGQVVTDRQQAMAIAIEESDNFFKADFTEDERKELDKKGDTIPGGSFPIRNEQDLRNAIRDVGRAKNPYKAKQWIKKKAKEMKLENILPADWIEKAFDITKEVASVMSDIKDSNNYTTYADVLFFNSKGELLLLQRNLFTTFEPNKWGLPGGHIDEGELPIKAAAREFTEETGIAIVDEELKPCATVIVPEHKCKIFYFVNFMDLETCDIVLNSQEHKNYEWVNLINIDNYNLIMNLKQVLKMLDIIPGSYGNTRQIVMYEEVGELKNQDEATSLVKACDFLMNVDSKTIWEQETVGNSTKSRDAIMINKAFLAELGDKTVTQNYVFRINENFNKSLKWDGWDYNTGLRKGTKEQKLALEALESKKLKENE